jgi:hypothetical protein
LDSTVELNFMASQRAIGVNDSKRVRKDISVSRRTRDDVSRKCLDIICVSWR